MATKTKYCIMTGLAHYRTSKHTPFRCSEGYEWEFNVLQLYIREGILSVVRSYESGTKVTAAIRTGELIAVEQ